MKTILLAVALFISSILSAQTDTLKSGVVNWNKLETNKQGRRQLIEGATRDLANLHIHSSTLAPGQANHPLIAYNDVEELIVVKEGHLTVTIGDTTRSLEPGGIALIVAGDKQRFQNSSNKAVIYYVLQLKSKAPVNMQRGKQAGGSFIRNWSEMVMRATDKGESRPIVDRPSSMFGRFEMHATALNPGFASHDPHTHRSEEIILMIKGNVIQQIGQTKHQASAGDLIYLASGVLHNTNNTGSVQCGYFAIQWVN
ncbi:MAG: cupin domain-containing protein [Chitinophagaceae bacterium]